MDYALIIILQVFGILCHVGQTVIMLDKLAPDDSTRDVMKMFWKQDKFTVMFSVVIIGLNLTFHFIAENYIINDKLDNHGLPGFIPYQYFHLFVFLLALVFGYGGQGIIFKVLGKSVDFVEKKALDKLQ